MTKLNNQEIVTIKSQHSVKTAAQRIEDILRFKGFKIFLVLDQKAEAEKIGMDMPATEVMMFGNPKIGTQLMNKYPALALELPIKLVIQEKDKNKSIIKLNSPEYMAERHNINDPIFNGLSELIKNAVA